MTEFNQVHLMKHVLRKVESDTALTKVQCYNIENCIRVAVVKNDVYSAMFAFGSEPVLSKFLDQLEYTNGSGCIVACSSDLLPDIAEAVGLIAQAIREFQWRH